MSRRSPWAAIVGGIRELKQQPGVFFGLCGLSALILASYGFVRPPVYSLFKAVHTSERLPWVWMAVAFGATGAVYIYNRYASVFPMRRMLAGAALCAAFGFVCLLSVYAGAPASWRPAVVFALYVWNDIYIVIVLEALWSYANLVYPLKSARVAYGLFCACGSIGPLLPELGQRYLAPAMGTANVPWLAVPVLLAVAWFALKLPAVDRPREERRPSKFCDGFAVVGKSSYLVYMLLLIATVQIVITVIDFQYNRAIEVMYPNVDERTGIEGLVFSIINVSALVLQLLTGVIVAIVGVRGVISGTPMVLGVAVVGFAVSPMFATIAMVKVASKALDYSIFRAAKEMLYLPLSRAEKTQGKALIDMLAYRVAKGAASLLLLGLGFFGEGAVSVLCLGLLAVWVSLALVIAVRYARVRAMENQ